MAELLVLPDIESFQVLSFSELKIVENLLQNFTFYIIVLNIEYAKIGNIQHKSSDFTEIPNSHDIRRSQKILYSRCWYSKHENDENYWRSMPPTAKLQYSVDEYHLLNRVKMTSICQLL